MKVEAHCGVDCRVLILSEDVSSDRFLKGLLEQAGFTALVSAESAEEALELARDIDFNLFVFHLSQPCHADFAALEALAARKECADFVPVLVISTVEDADAKWLALSAGATDYIRIPQDAPELVLRVKNLVGVRRVYQQLAEDKRRLEKKVLERTREIVERLAHAAEYRDDDTGQHAKRVGDLSGAIAAALGRSADEVVQIRLAATLHDLGKIGIPDAILAKPGKLTEAEYEIMKEHTRIGAEVLAGSTSPLLQMAEVIALSHHEKWDGSGYPLGLEGEAIPLYGRIVAVADVYDALIRCRPYKAAMPQSEAIELIQSESGKHFDPSVVEAFLRAVELDTSEELALAA